MSKQALGIQHSAFGQAPVLLDLLLSVSLPPRLSSRSSDQIRLDSERLVPIGFAEYLLASGDFPSWAEWPLAECRVLSAECPVPQSANEFTVTTAVTSVMNRGLADSVLIGVSGFALGQGFTRGLMAGRRQRGRRYCSFAGGTCI